MNTFENEKWKLEISQSECCKSPREWDNLSKMICFHRRYNLGDKHDYNHNDYNSWEELKQAIIRNEDVAVIKPIYMYDHSGITISTSPFSCPWDSGQIGFIIVTKQAIRENYSIKYVTEKYKQKAIKVALAEVETYDLYVTGEVYGFYVTNKETGEDDSRGGFYGYDFWKNGMCDNIETECIISLYDELKAEYGKDEWVESKIKELV